MKNSMLKLLIGSLYFSTIIGIIIILFGLFNGIFIKILLTSLLVFVFSIPSLFCSIIYDKEKLHYLSVVGMMLSFIACLYTSLLVWGIIGFSFELFSDNYQLKFLLSIYLLCFSIGHLSLIMLINNKNNIVLYFKKCTLICSVILNVMLLALFWSNTVFELYYRILWILGILVSFGTISLPIFNKLYKEEDIGVFSSKKSEVSLDNIVISEYVNDKVVDTKTIVLLNNE